MVDSPSVAVSLMQSNELPRMMFKATHAVFLAFLLNLSVAQDSQDSENPLAVPACSTMLSIVESCDYKLINDDNTITASVSSFLCFDASGNHAPAVYDNAVAGCSSAYPDLSVDFDFWLPGICTGAAPAAAASTTARGSAVGRPTTAFPTTSSTEGVI